MLDPEYWSVTFDEKLDLPLDPSKLKDGQVSPEVLQEIRGAMRNAVISTLRAHKLLVEPKPEQPAAQAAEVEVEPIKFARAPIKQDGPSD